MGGNTDLVDPVFFLELLLSVSLPPTGSLSILGNIVCDIWCLVPQVLLLQVLKESPNLALLFLISSMITMKYMSKRKCCPATNVCMCVWNRESGEWHSRCLERHDSTELLLRANTRRRKSVERLAGTFWLFFPWLRLPYNGLCSVLDESREYISSVSLYVSTSTLQPYILRSALISSLKSLLVLVTYVNLPV